MLERIESLLDRTGRALMQWWLWPAALVFSGVLALTLSWICYPVDNDVHAFGMDLMGPCEVREAYGYPCAGCGMTRSWVHIARGHVLTALRYNIAGALLWAMLVGGGLVGALRLLAGRGRLLRFPWLLTLAVWAGWVGLYAISWGFRWVGWYPLD